VDGRVLVAMSGGIDSAMAAILLREAGHAVEGLTMRIWRSGVPDEAPDPDIEAAASLCRQLDMAHHTLDLREAFFEKVVAPFVAAYAGGRTPNPCIGCNQHLKFGALLDYALAHDTLLATGHYCRIETRDGRYRLLRGVDERKDQSYFLYRLNQRALAHTLFPLGDLSKARVRQMARERGLSLAERPESQDVCFLGGAPDAAFVAAQAPEAVRLGPIIDRTGRQLGEHRGLAHYTIGQRAGLGISAPRALYVLALDPERNAVIAGYSEALGHSRLIAGDMSYVAGQAPKEPLSVQCKIRYRARPAEATLCPLDAGRARFRFERELRDITPGQAVVAYLGDEVLGGGTIISPE